MGILSGRLFRILVVVAVVTVGGQMRSVIGTADAAGSWCELIWMYQRGECQGMLPMCPPPGTTGYDECIAAFNTQVQQCYDDADKAFLKCIGAIQ